MNRPLTFALTALLLFGTLALSAPKPAQAISNPSHPQQDFDSETPTPGTVTAAELDQGVAVLDEVLTQ